jgi:hypothetical protein
VASSDAKLLALLIQRLLEQTVNVKIAALKAEVDLLKSQWASGSPEWADLKAKYDAAVVRVGELEAQLANAPVPSGLDAEDEAAIDAMVVDTRSVSQGIADSRTVNSPAN